MSSIPRPEDVKLIMTDVVSQNPTPSSTTPRLRVLHELIVECPSGWYFYHRWPYPSPSYPRRRTIHTNPSPRHSYHRRHRQTPLRMRVEHSTSSSNLFYLYKRHFFLKKVDHFTDLMRLSQISSSSSRKGGSFKNLTSITIQPRVVMGQSFMDHVEWLSPVKRSCLPLRWRS